MTEEVTNIPEAAATEEQTPNAVASPGSVSELKPKMKVKGTVTRTELYGAFIDLGVGTDAIIHISQMGDKRVNRVADVVNIGDEVDVWIDKVDPQRNQITVTMVEPLAVDWSDLEEGQVYTGTVTRLENFGAFVNIGAEKEGLVHISELSHDYIKQPSDVVKVGDEIQVQVLSFKKRKRRINLSMKALLERPESAPPPVQEAYEAYEEEDEPMEMPTAMEIALRRAMGESAPTPRPRGNRGRRDKGRRGRRQQDDIISRTLDLANEK